MFSKGGTGSSFLFMLYSRFLCPLLLVFLITGIFLIKLTKSDEMDLYNTKQATSDLRWERHSKSDSIGWEEVSNPDVTNNIIRSYQICESDKPDRDNWIRSPYISKRGGNQFFVEIEYSIKTCRPTFIGQGKNSNCKETFNLFYYQASNDVASSTFPPWHETPYKKIDTVAANNPNGLNKKTFTFGPLQREGFYIAVQDQGACMSLMSLRIFYYYCPETTVDLVSYPKTSSAAGHASLETVQGRCAANAVNARGDLLYRCSSNGHWQIATGRCYCDAGYEANSLNTECLPCVEGTYKLNSGSQNCVQCPLNSGNSPSHTPTDRQLERQPLTPNRCPCHPGYARAPGEDISKPCIGPPLKPLLLQYSNLNATSVTLRWNPAPATGGKSEIFYNFSCERRLNQTLEVIWKPCSSAIKFLVPPRGKKNSVRVVRLEPDTRYRVKVYALNDAFSSKLDSPISGSQIEFHTEQAVPSIVGQVTITERLATSFTIKWEEPIHKNGALRSYEVEITSTSWKNVSYEKTSSSSITLKNLRKDSEYRIRVRAQNTAGYGPYSAPYVVKPLSTSEETQSSSQEGLDLLLIVVVAVGGIFVVLAIIVIFRYCKTGKFLCLHPPQKKRRSAYNPELFSQNSLRKPLIVDLPPLPKRIYVEYPDPEVAIERMGRRVDREAIKIQQKIGEGEFAEVCQAEMQIDHQCCDVAVKFLKSGATQKDELNFLREASNMAQFDHPNIIRLVGVITKDPPITVITEYMENRSLDRFLQRNPGKLSLLQLLQMLKGIASGLSYLSVMKYIHRDLAARNILVDSKLNCKISDFGLSRTFENNPHATYTTQGGKIAVRWTALESILYGKFTLASDVWSYGIVAWEVMSYGEKPYWEMTNDDVIANIEKGMRLPSPVDCPKALHQLMLACWSSDPDARPTSIDIVRDLDVFLRQPAQLSPDPSLQTYTICPTAEILMSPNLGRAMDNGQVDSVDKWLELQRLSKYAEQFRERGINDLEKVSNLTISDLKSLGIDVTLHINKLENGIRTLKRHLSCSSNPTPSSRNSSVPSGTSDPLTLETRSI